MATALPINDEKALQAAVSANSSVPTMNDHPIVTLRDYPTPPDFRLDHSQEVAPLVAAIRSILAEQMKSLVIHLISSAPGEGVSTLARALAFGAAGRSTGNVLLVDGNPKQGNQQDFFGVQQIPDLWPQANAPAPIQTVALTMEGRRICHLARMPLDRRSAGKDYDTRLVPLLYARLRRSFALTIVDGPSVVDGPDYVYASDICDGVILVVEAEKTRIPVVMRAKEDLEMAGATIIGVVMNKRRRYIPESIYRHL